jgi:predicted transcriptional regulator
MLDLARWFCRRVPVYVRTRKKKQRKAEILGILARAKGPMTYAQVAGAVGIYPVRQVSRDLQRYAGFGYVRRWKAAGKYRYEITRRGAERLAYFNRWSRKP